MTPGQAQHFLNAMRALFRWAVKMQLIKTDPTAGIEAPARRRDAGIRPWTEEDVAAYENRWPIGTRQRVWLDVLALYRTPARRCRAAGAPTRPRRHSDHQDGEDRDDRYHPDPAGVGRDTGGRSMRRPIVHRWRARPADGEDKASAMSSQSLAVLRACRARHMACARSPRHGRPMPALQSPSWKRSSDGRAERWRRIILEPPIGSGLQSAPCTSW